MAAIENYVELVQGEVECVTYIGTQWLDGTELFSSAAAAEDTTTDLTLAASVLDAEWTDADGRTIAANTACRVTISGQLSATGAYVVDCTLTTDGDRKIKPRIRIRTPW
jgi:hypothetical protein